MGSETKTAGRIGESRRLVPILALATLAATGCSTYVPFDGERQLRDDFYERVEPELHSYLRVPYELDDDVRASFVGRINPGAPEVRRSEAVQDYIFGTLELEYTLTPTRDAVGTFHAHQGNCLSFVNLFVGVAREVNLNPFYVEVQDYQRWNYQDGVVVSRGHIVAGMYIDGNLATFDFLPYRPKSYRDFKPIDDLTAMAHFYNNLGAEALIAGDLDEADRMLQIATSLAPTFDKALNNRGIVLLRQGDLDGAIELYEFAREIHPEEVPILSNLTRAYQQAGETEKATALLDTLEQINRTNPFFFIYRGDVALANGDFVTALDYMRRAYKADSRLPEVHVGLARVYLALGKTDEAQHHVERALRLDATHEEARKYAAMLSRGDVP